MLAPGEIEDEATLVFSGGLKDGGWAALKGTAPVDEARAWGEGDGRESGVEVVDGGHGGAQMVSRWCADGRLSSKIASFGFKVETAIEFNSIHHRSTVSAPSAPPLILVHRYGNSNWPSFQFSPS